MDKQPVQELVAVFPHCSQSGSSSSHGVLILGGGGRVKGWLSPGSPGREKKEGAWWLATACGDKDNNRQVVFELQCFFVVKSLYRCHSFSFFQMTLDSSSAAAYTNATYLLRNDAKGKRNVRYRKRVEAKEMDRWMGPRLFFQIDLPGTHTYRYA